MAAERGLVDCDQVGTSLRLMGRAMGSPDRCGANDEGSSKGWELTRIAGIVVPLRVSSSTVATPSVAAAPDTESTELPQLALLGTDSILSTTPVKSCDFMD